ncbi:hypothetical protein PpBr36_03685 [Pyricularia pennisetigena]|uniref:hypothetical protein n=1 Tax=Pyricularia pennisetigena TaxID=1578925 RepID=UPI0011531FE0|nr:hypothetical protein PpBr36_03685 [Pyricularia pennisetigena]TLS31597.1 hypothetical protein PpBr36_03685 [Pyricularia pennisetigena]
MARPRRSTRLAANAALEESTLPKQELGSVEEADETSPVEKTPAKKSKLPKSTKSARGKTPKTQPVESSPSRARDTAKDEAPAASSPFPRTPASSAIKPPATEMHPEHYHASTAAPSSALHLGFSDINPAGPLNSSPTVEVTQRAAAAPSRRTSTVPSAPFTFHLENPGAATGGLSERTKALLEDMRGDIEQIAADLRAKRDQEKAEAEANGRKIASAKGKRGRFSDVHWKELQKMDSIVNHPSVQRYKTLNSNGSSSSIAGNGPTSPAQLTKGIKRTQSKANLNDSEARRGVVTAESSRKPPAKFPISPAKRQNGLFGGSSDEVPVSAVKRARQRIEDDASSARPVSRDASSIPRPTTAGREGPSLPRSHTTTSALMTPTKSSLARSVASAAKPGPSGALSATAPPGRLKTSASNSSLAMASKIAAPVRSPSRFDRIKSMLRGGQKDAGPKPSSTLPVPKASGLKTPSTSNLDKPLPAVPATTPSRKLMKRVVFTPDSKKPVTFLGNDRTPSPLKSILKSGLPRSKTMGKLPEVHYPNLDTVMDEGEGQESSVPAVQYPDLQTLTDGPPEPTTNLETDGLSSAVPGTFTFRSDHTIEFGGTSPVGFGGSRGQSSVRHVRQSTMAPQSPMAMPGSFPDSVSEFSHGGSGISGQRENKENRAPAAFLPAVKHGLDNKKRHRADSDDEDEDSDERATKRARQIEDGEALFGSSRGAKGSVSVPPKARKQHPRTMLYSSPKKPSEFPGVGTKTPSPVKRSGISLSRLSMLARPKMRKHRYLPQPTIVPWCMLLCWLDEKTQPSMRSILKTSVSAWRPVLSTAASEPSIPIRRDTLDPRYQPVFICSFCHQAYCSPPHVVGKSARLTCEGCYRTLIDLAVCWKCGELVYRGDACVSLGWCFWHRVCFGCLFCGGRTSVQEAWGKCDSGGDMGTERCTQGWDGDGHGIGQGDDWQEQPHSGRGAAVELDEIPLCQHCLLNMEGDGVDEDEIVRLALDSAHQRDVELIRARYEKNKQATSGPHATMPKAQDEVHCQLTSSIAVVSQVDAVCPDHIETDGAASMTGGKHMNPFSNTIYVSMSDPLNGPSFKPRPTKSIPLQMQPFARHGNDAFKLTGLTCSCATGTPRPQIQRQRYSYVSNEPNLRPSLHMSLGWTSTSIKSFDGPATKPSNPTRDCICTRARAASTSLEWLGEYEHIAPATATTRPSGSDGIPSAASRNAGAH